MDWPTLMSTFMLVFTAELGDKTQLAVVAQTCRHRRPWSVFAGASLALVSVTALGVLGGQALARVIHPSVLRIVAAASFVLMGLWIARESLAGPTADETNDCPSGDLATEAANSPMRRNWQAFLSTFGLLFMAELGDKTQLAVLSLSGRNTSRIAVFLGGALALTAVTALGVLGGEELRRRIPEKLLLRISAVAFVAAGVLLGVGAF